MIKNRKQELNLGKFKTHDSFSTLLPHSGRGPLETTKDVINAAKKISEAGTKLDKLTREIADQCPESSTKKDLLAYLQRIALYCHQIQITSKVKADVQNISGELIVSGVIVKFVPFSLVERYNLPLTVCFLVPARQCHLAHPGR